MVSAVLARAKPPITSQTNASTENWTPPMAKAKKAKQANPRAARPAKKTPARKVANKKPQPAVRKKVSASKTAKKPKKKPAPRRPQAVSRPDSPVTGPAATPTPPAVAAARVISPPAPASPRASTFSSSPVVAGGPAVPAVELPEPLVETDPLGARRKGVRKATITSGLHDQANARRLGRSRIPVDAPLDVVFQNDTQAREAFAFLGIQSIRELETFTADDIVLRLTGPAKITVGRIRKILAMNNRCLRGDEDFAVDFQEQQRNPARDDQ